MSDEVGTNLVGAGQLVTCGTGFFSLAGKSGYSPRVIAALRARMRTIAPRLALLQEQAARLGGAVPVMTLGQNRRRDISAGAILRHRCAGRRQSKTKGILLLHDIHPATVAALPGLLKELRQRDFHIVHVVPTSVDQF